MQVLKVQNCKNTLSLMLFGDIRLNPSQGFAGKLSECSDSCERCKDVFIFAKKCSGSMSFNLGWVGDPCDCRGCALAFFVLARVSKERIVSKVPLIERAST